jgi:putative NADH-flavin reductase
MRDAHLPGATLTHKLYNAFIPQLDKTRLAQALQDNSCAVSTQSFLLDLVEAFLNRWTSTHRLFVYDSGTVGHCQVKALFVVGGVGALEFDRQGRFVSRFPTNQSICGVVTDVSGILRHQCDVAKVV